MFLSSNSSYYLVVNQLTTIMLTFTDTEQDLINITILQNSFINTFVQSTSNTNQFIIMLQTNEASNDSTNLVICCEINIFPIFTFQRKNWLKFFMENFLYLSSLIPKNNCNFAYWISTEIIYQNSYSNLAVYIF